MACNHCRGSLTLPEGYTSAAIRCHWCDAAAKVPEYLRSTNLADVMAELDEPVAVVVPYAVPGTGLKPCPECRGELPIAATFCVHCGTPLIGPDREKLRRQYTPIDREWHDGWPPHFRKALFLMLMIINAALVLLNIIVRKDDMTLVSGWSENIAYSIVPVLIQAFLLGTYGSLRAIRERDGHASIWRTWHCAFIPLRPKLVPLADCAGVGTLPPAPGISELLVCAVLFTMCIVPGAIFLFMVVLRVRVNVELVNDLRGKEATILRGKSVAEAEEAAKVVAEATGMTWHKVL